jgi:hypothetical protein
VMIKVLYAGPSAEARRLLAPLWRAAGEPLLDEIRPTTFAKSSMGGTPVRHLDLFDAVGDEVIGVLLRASEQAGTVEVRHWGGALGRTGPDTGPVGRRSTRLSVIVDTVVPGLADELRPHASGGGFLNFMADPSRTAAAYEKDDYARLREIKRAYDPDGVFHVGHVTL